MTDPRITVDPTAPVSREDYDRMADQRDDFRKLAHSLKSALAAAHGDLKHASKLANLMPYPSDDAEGFGQEEWFELTQSLDSAVHRVRRTLEASPKLTG